LAIYPLSLHDALPIWRLDAVLEFVAFAARPMPLVTLLDEAPRRIAAIVEAPVCSLYLVEGDGHELVMRGNIGFPASAIGQVRLRSEEHTSELQSLAYI